MGIICQQGKYTYFNVIFIFLILVFVFKEKLLFAVSKYVCYAQYNSCCLFSYSITIGFGKFTATCNVSITGIQISALQETNCCV